MKDKYQIEYENTIDCFWAKEPAKYVKLFIDKYSPNISGLKGLDLGAGEGKNSVFLAAMGATIDAVDISPIALSRFNKQPNYDKAANNIKIICKDIRNIQYPENHFDFIIAYGIFHCLSSTLEIENYINQAKTWVKPNGYFICVTFTNELPPPDTQSYLEYESFLEEGQLEDIFNKWHILESENDIITEVHPTCTTEHQHSLIRLIAKKYE